MSKPRRTGGARSASDETRDARPRRGRAHSTSSRAQPERRDALERELAAIRAERDELPVEETRWRRLAEQSPLGITAYRPDGTVKYANRAVRELFELTEEENALLVAQYNILEDPRLRESGALEHIRKAFAGEVSILPPTLYDRPFPMEGRPVRRWLEGVMYPVRDGEGAIQEIVLIHTDITPERRRLELRVQHAQKLESLGILAGGIAHDFNNLLMGILGNADVALVRLAPESPARVPLERIKVASQRAAELTNQMLAYSGRSSFRPESLDLNRVVEDMTHLLRAGISKKARLRFELAEVLPSILADVTQVRQVVMNLITNAADALGDDEGVIHVTTKLVEVDRPSLVHCDVGELRASGPYVSLEVTDTGTGMDEATRRRMFDPFFTTKSTGRGLGLAAVLGIVRSHEAALRVESAPGEGTRFTLLFPSSAKRAQLTRSDPASEPIPDGGATILLVDDEPTVREVTETLLQEAGYRVLLAADGHEAVKAVKEQGGGIDLVLLDMSMPGLSGEEALQEMRSMKPGVRVLLSSGYAEPDTGALPPENLAGFIQKPYGAEELRRKVAAALAIPRKRRS